MTERDRDRRIESLREIYLAVVYLLSLCVVADQLEWSCVLVECQDGDFIVGLNLIVILGNNLECATQSNNVGQLAKMDEEGIRIEL